ncbi:MAG TPA: potassium transporter [Spongiibacteraceae bacterium]|nr:potassium transporter [Spongiibacteraceae bacterium]HCS26161.1 potassium transporter [Spongiibacteraceae bacterium]
MHFAVIARIIGMLLMVFSLTMLVPAVVSAFAQDGAAGAFLTAFVLCFASGGLLWLFVRRSHGELNIRDGFLVVSLFWSVLGWFGSLPFLLAESIHLPLSDAVFESISGLTTTGATVIVGLDDLPVSILFYRQLLQWLGGIGIIVIAVAILPILGIGGMQLYRAETPGPVKDSKLTPRITGTAKALFLIYLYLTIACTVAYWLAGMSGFDAICHAFSTVAIGGFSTHDASLGYFENGSILIIASVFMLLAGINFGVHFFAWRSKRIYHYLRDSETRFYLLGVLLASALVVAFLRYTNTYDAQDSLLLGVFHTISIATTTGFAAADFSVWPVFLPVLLILMSFMGGCGGSTAGGIKVVRIMLIAKQGVRELKQLIHPNAIIPLKVGSKRVDAKVVSAVWSFFAVYMFSFLLILLALMACNMDYPTAFSATAANLNNLGPGLGDVSANYGSITQPAKWILCYAMLLGRLEIFTLLVLFTPAFWRH